MPIEYWIDDERRVVFVEGQGVFTDDDVLGYQKEVWSRPEVAGYGELVDMSGVTQVELPSPKRIGLLAALSASMDPPGPPSKLAIVAPEDMVFGLGKMYQARRSLEPASTKEVRVFREREPAIEWLKIEDGVTNGA